METLGCQPVRNGLQWMLPILTKGDVRSVAVDGRSGIGLMTDLMKAAKVHKPVVPAVTEVIKAYALFEQALSSASIVHMEQPAVTQVVTNCDKRAIGSNGGFGYKSIKDGADIAILDSIVLAHWQCVEQPAKRKVQQVMY